MDIYNVQKNVQFWGVKWVPPPRLQTEIPDSEVQKRCQSIYHHTFSIFKRNIFGQKSLEHSFWTGQNWRIYTLNDVFEEFLEYPVFNENILDLFRRECFWGCNLAGLCHGGGGHATLLHMCINRRSALVYFLAIRTHRYTIITDVGILLISILVFNDRYLT